VVASVVVAMSDATVEGVGDDEAESAVGMIDGAVEPAVTMPDTVD
jgi:hypothetical protein